MMSELAKLVMPQGWTRNKLGTMDDARFRQTADIALQLNVITKPAVPAQSYTNELVEAAMRRS